jgi:hypothetical protein
MKMKSQSVLNMTTTGCKSRFFILLAIYFCRKRVKFDIWIVGLRPTFGCLVVERKQVKGKDDNGWFEDSDYGAQSADGHL